MGESIYHGLVVDKDVDWLFGRGGEVMKSQRFGPPGGLGQAVDAGGVVEPVVGAIVDAVARAGEERVGLVGAGAVGGGIDPPGAVVVVVVFIVVRVVVVFLTGPRDWLWERVIAEVPL